MIQLVTTTDKLQLVTSAAVPVDVLAFFTDLAGGAATPGKQAAAINAAATNDILAAPAAATFRRLQCLSIRNKGAANVTVTVLFDANGTDYELHEAILAPEQVLLYMEGVGWLKQDHVAGSNLRSITTADQAIGASVTVYLTGSAIDVTSLKVGTLLRWMVTLAKTGAGTVAHTLDVRFGANGTTGDTSRASQATGTQTAVADVARYYIDLIVRAIGAAGNFHGAIELCHSANAAGFDNARANIITEALSANFDMTVANLKAGLSITTGASHSFNVRQVIAERIDP